MRKQRRLAWILTIISCREYRILNAFLCLLSSHLQQSLCHKCEVFKVLQLLLQAVFIHVLWFSVLPDVYCFGVCVLQASLCIFFNPKEVPELRQ